MILRRFADALRRQDWFVVVLEIFIVVVGIFIGLQVDDWNERRKNLAEEQVYLSRLLNDTQHNMREMELQRDRADQRATSIKTVVTFLKAGTPDAISGDDLVRTFCRWGTLIPAEFRSATFDELVSTGRINIIGDPDLRERLQLNSALHQRFENELDEMEDIAMRVRQNIGPFVLWHLDPENLEAASCNADVTAMADRPAMISSLVELIRSNTLISRFNEEELEGLQKLLEMLKDEADSRSGDIS